MRLETLFEKFELFADGQGAVSKMRELVLQLGVAGKLTQDVGISTSLWELAPLGQVVRLRRGYDLPTQSRKDGSFPIYAANGTVGFHDKLAVKGPGVVTGRSGSIGKVHYVPVDYWPLNTALYAEDFFGNDSKFVCLLLRSMHLERFSTSTAVPTLNRNVVHKEMVGVPPIAEQKQIVAKVDELMALCDRLDAQQQQRQTRHTALARASLSRFAEAPTPANLDFLFHDAYAIDPADLRKSIFTLAVSGKLVPQDQNDDSVEDLLALNDGRRRESARRDHRADEENQPFLSGDDRWDIADTWSWRGLADLVLFVDYRGKTPAKLSSGVRLLTAKNVRKGQINLSPEEFLSKTEYDSWMTRGFPIAGDVLFTTEAPMGNAAVVELTERFALAQRVICFQSYGALHPAFLVLQILSNEFQIILDKNGTGVTAKGIKASKLKQLPIAVPPLAEQRRIVAKVDQLMALVDQLEARLAAAMAAGSDMLDAAIHELLNLRRVEPAALRIAVGCHIVLRMAGKRYFGRTTNMKALFLAQAHIGLDLGVHPIREAAGPFDPWIYQFERKAAEERWFETIESVAGTGNKKVEYRPGPALPSQAVLAETWLASAQRAELDRLLGLLAEKTTEEAEIIATLFAAWNDALIDGLIPSDDDIVLEVRDNWHVGKQRFGHARLKEWLEWLRRNQLVPRGYSSRTAHQPKLIQ